MSRIDLAEQIAEDLAPTQVTLPTMLPGKAAVAAPQLSGEDKDVEMKKIPPSEVESAAHVDIMQLARLGDVESIRNLYDAGTFSPTYCDAEGITPLHWAAINNQYAMCKFLLESGCDVNKKGGESVATPAMWAAQRCHYYTVHLLLQYGADPLITDVQGYNILHLATFEGNIFLLILLLHQNIPVDVRDTQGHTCLMWSAYKGYPACVELFLRWGADVHVKDDTGFTALHWSLVKGSQGCIQKLIEYGSDRFLAASSGKTPAVMAEEMRTTRAWHKALQERGFNEDATAMNLDLPPWLLKDKRGTMTKFLFFWPFLILWSMFMISSHMVIFAGIPLALFVGYAMQYAAQQIIRYAPSDMKHMHKTPWLAGIFSATLCLVGIRWLSTILPATFSQYPFTNLAFGVCYGLCAYFYFCTMFYDSGFVPKLGGLQQQKGVIDELLSLWIFDEHHFCVACMVRMPLRSKHCKRCNRCVAKHDHHCPWVYNCVGVNNHRQFVSYLIFLEFGIGLVVRLTIGYYTGIRDQGSEECNLLAPSLCRLVNTDSYTMVLMIWAALQLTWVTMLLFVQLVQISRAMTTYENMHGAHHGHGGKALDSVTSALATGTASTRGAQLDSAGRGPDPVVDSHRHHHHHQGGCFAQWKKLLGVDTFVETALHGYEGNRSSRRRDRNPFSRGCLRNCKDFCCDPAPMFGHRENGAAMLDGQIVNYTSMYETPPRMTARPRLISANDGTYESIAAEEV